jgi:hypothetical protein
MLIDVLPLHEFGADHLLARPLHTPVRQIFIFSHYRKNERSPLMIRPSPPPARTPHTSFPVMHQIVRPLWLIRFARVRGLRFCCLCPRWHNPKRPPHRTLCAADAIHYASLASNDGKAFTRAAAASLPPTSADSYIMPTLVRCCVALLCPRLLPPSGPSSFVPLPAFIHA